MASAAARKRTGFEFAVEDREWIVERRHEDAADGVDDQRALAALGVDQRRAAARRALRKIRRANQPRRALDEHQRLALIPGMVAERDRIGAGVDEFLVDRLGDAEATGGVLAIDDDEIERPVTDHAGQMLRDGGAPGPADHVTDEKNAQIMNSGNRTLRFPLAHNPAPRRAATPVRPRFPAPRRRAPIAMTALVCADARRCNRNVRRHSRCGGRPVERRQRHQHDVGDHLGRCRRRLGNAERPAAPACRWRTRPERSATGRAPSPPAAPAARLAPRACASGAPDRSRCGSANSRRRPCRARSRIGSPRSAMACAAAPRCARAQRIARRQRGGAEVGSLNGQGAE